MTAHQDPEDALRTSSVVVALFVDQDTAEQAISDLRQAGLDEDAIVVTEPEPTPEVADRPGRGVLAGAAEGAVSGGVVGGILGVLGSLLLPGVGPDLAQGLFAPLLAGGILGAIAGGLIGALVMFGGDYSRAQADSAKGTLVTVLADGEAIEPRTILGLLWKRRERRNLPSFNYVGPERRMAGFA
jgi:hypothetical protein